MNSDRGYKQLFFLLFTPFALQMTYLNLYFERRGMGHSEIGTLNALFSAVSIVSPLIFGTVADRLRHKRPVILWLSVGSAFFFTAHYFGASLLVLVPLTVVLALCRSPLIPLTDALCLDALQARGDHSARDYASIRLWGSVGWVIAASLLPLILPSEEHSDPIGRLAPIFYGSFAFGLLLVLRTATLPDPALPERKLEYDEPAGSVLAVLRLPHLKRLIVLLLIGWMANCTYYVFLSLYLDDIGVGDQWKGAYWSMGVVAEVCLMAFGGRLLKRLGVRRLLLLGLFGRTIRLLALSWRLSPAAVLLLVQPLHALAFGAVHLGTMAFMAEAVPERQRAIGQTVVASIVGGLGGVMGNLLAGWASEAASAGQLAALTSRTGFYAAFLLAGWLHLAVFVAAWLTLRNPTRPPSRELVETAAAAGPLESG